MGKTDSFSLKSYYLPIALHLGEGPVGLPSSMLACALVLPVFRSSLGNYFLGGFYGFNFPFVFGERILHTVNMYYCHRLIKH